MQISPCCSSYSDKHLQSYCKCTYPLHILVIKKILLPNKQLFMEFIHRELVDSANKILFLVLQEQLF